ncbi:MAG: hypothetical protein EOO36_14640 [Cytophagaceae bacterium]|nr:MAG: hypothetical protein EOO36_14640 [Cytophagaceae bacterium]
MRNVYVESFLYPDFSLRWHEKRQGVLCTMVQYCVDASVDNPDWQPAVVLDRLNLESKDLASDSTLRGEVTGSGYSVAWNGSLFFEEEDNFHLLLFKDGRRMARSYRALPQTPLIPFNKHGRFRTAGWLRRVVDGRQDIRTGGSSDRAQVFGPNREIIRIHFHDEFNDFDIQSNESVDFHECGLMLGTFGTTGSELNGDNSAANACGNAQNALTQWVPDIQRWRATYSGETVHGIHFFDTLNLESIQLIEISL